MPTFTLGQGYNFYFGLSATAPTTPADETQGAYNKIGEIPGDISISRSRSVIDRRTRDAAFDRFIHMGDRTSDVTFTMNLDVEDNAGYQDLQAAYDSDTDGVGTTGTHGYWIVTDATASNLLWHGIGSPSDLSVVAARDNLITVNCTIASEAVTEATHA